MEINEKNMSKLTRLLAVMDDDTLTRKEFIDAFQKVVDLVLQIKAENERVVTMIKGLYDQMAAKLENDSVSGRSELKKQITDYCEKEMSGMMKAHEKKMSEMDEKMETIKSGKDADEEKIVQDVLTQIKLPKQKEIILDGPKELKSKLESLKGDDRINIDAINGLDEEFKRLKDILSGIPRARAMGRAKVPITRWIYLTDQVDGATTTFTLPPDVVAIHGLMSTQFPQVWNTTDYSFAGRTLTTNFTMQAGQTLIAICDVLFYP